MIFMSLYASLFVLLIANAIVWRARNATTVGLWFSSFGLIGSIVLSCLLPLVVLQTLLLSGATFVWRRSQRGPAFFFPLSCGATLITYGVAGMMVLNAQRERAQLRRLYPFESMESRLPEPKRPPVEASLSPAAMSLSRLEWDVPYSFRGYALRLLHEDSLELFINSPGFGFGRGIRPRVSQLSFEPPPVPLQPCSGFPSIWSPGESTPMRFGMEDRLIGMHEGSAHDFANARSFGYFKDLRHVAGFEPHRFSKVPEPVNRWKVERLELVGLVLHDEPEVYLSDHLPKMDRLHNTPTRPLDRFESFGLNVLRRGEVVYITQEEEGIRMLGAVRSTKQCVGCHGGERGDLLGAFSYVLRPDGS